MEWSTCWAGFALAALAIGLGVTTPGEDEREARIEWLRQHSIAFDTVEPGNGFEGLQPIAELVGDARIVSLGESTHGSREIFQMKHRLMEFLASELGFSIFSIEASMPESFAVGEWVRGGEGDPHQLVEGMYFWTWHTEEVLAMVEWMRSFNERGEAEVDFTGFDMQTPDVAAEIALDFIDQADPEWAPKARELYLGISEARGTSSAFGVATGSFPVEKAQGRTLIFSGDIKTELEEGYAGLWWRADAASGLAFDNMATTGPRGSTDWERYTVELEIPDDTTNINFGMIMPGKGKAWFDDLRIELDGELFEDPESFALNFENRTPIGFFSPPGSYRVRTSWDDATSGQRCLEMSYQQPTGLSADEGVDRSREVLEQMESQRDDYAIEFGDAATDWAVQNARVVLQCMQQRSNDRAQTRDRSMADNVAWIAGQRPDERLVLWAHNGHVARRRGWMGFYLDHLFGDEQLVVGFATSAGEYYAVNSGSSGQGNHALAEPPEGSFEDLMEELDEPFLIVDLRSAEAGSAESGWLHEPIMFRSIGALEMDNQFSAVPLAREFDLIVYIRDTQAARQLPWKRR